jgi:hypothetical protein
MWMPDARFLYTVYGNLDAGCRVPDSCTNKSELANCPKTVYLESGIFSGTRHPDSYIQYM